MQACFDEIGVSHSYLGSFPNIEMNTVSHLHLVQFIERAIADRKPEIIITHHPSDTNNDHCQTSVACRAAFRLFQRREDVPPVAELWYMEVASSTDWSVDTATAAFRPNLFVGMGADGLAQKIPPWASTAA